MNPEISIIVPVYNLKYLLPKCVDSILNQTFTDFELILVDDGSTDNSGILCDEYAKNDSRVKVIHKQNGGVASSRNAGLEVARGKYIGFVDNADYINLHMFEILHKLASLHSSDIAVCDYVRVDEDQGVNTEFIKPDSKVKHFSNIEALNEIYKGYGETFIYPWNKLYKRSLFKNINYEVGNLYDDESVAHELLYKGEKVTYINQGLYYYINRNDSMVNTSFHIKKFGRIYALKDREIFFRKQREFTLHQKALKHYMETFFWYYYMAKTHLEGIDKELKDLKHTFDKSLIHLLKLKDISWKQKIMCVVFSMSPSLFEFIKNTSNKSIQRKI